ncbi:class I SAM-dependent methyltransferase [Proteobacteria bacterium 005FR1]|nr:class I SAM-dependent methyltransferase [Proteobacteria bacterium 005FR1]
MTYPRIRNRLDVIGPYIDQKKVLDIGCVDCRPGGIRKYESTGLHKFILSKANSVVGVDIDGAGVEEMCRNGYTVICDSAESMRLGEKFDCIVAGELIEHLNNAGLFLETMREHMADDGVLILTTPNACSISNTISILKKNRIKVHPDHTCWYDPVTLNQLVGRFRLRVKALYFTNKEKWYRPRYFYKIFRYQMPKFFTWLRPYFSGTLVAVIEKAD